MSPNPIFNAIEDALVRCLEAGAQLPHEFTIVFADDAFHALLAAGVGDSSRAPLSPETRWLRFAIAGHAVTIIHESLENLRVIYGK